MTPDASTLRRRNWHFAAKQSNAPARYLLIEKVTSEFTSRLAGGFTSGGFNFDTKLRRQSMARDDLFHGHIGGIDTLAQALLVAERLVTDGDLKEALVYREAIPLLQVHELMRTDSPSIVASASRWSFPCFKSMPW